MIVCSFSLAVALLVFAWQTPMASENSASARGGGCEKMTARPLVPPTVTPSTSIISEDSLSDTELDDFHLEQAVGGILREVEVRDYILIISSTVFTRK